MSESDRAGTVLHRVVIVGVAALVVASVVVSSVALARSGPAAGAAGAAVPGCAAGAGAARITVHGTGTSAGPPDLLTIVMSVNTTAPSATGSLSENNADAATLITSVGRAGVPARDVQTTGLSLQPQYDYRVTPATITGYSVTQTLTIRLRDMSSAGAVIGTAAASIGNSISLSGMAFSLSNDSSIAATAREMAVRQALSYARAVASASGRRLGPLCSATDVTPTPPMTAFQPQAFNLAAMSQGTAVPVQGGAERVSATVTMTFATRT